MRSKEGRSLKKYIFWALIAGLIVLSALIISDYIIPVVSAFILAYLTRPLFILLNRKLNKTLSALICIFIILVAIILPLGLITGKIVQEANNSLIALENEPLNDALEKIKSYLFLSRVNINLDDLAQKGINILISLLGTIFTSIFSILFSLIITLLGVYYILAGWNNLSLKLKEYIPFKNKERTIKELEEVTNLIVYGSILIAIIEFAIGVLGFWLSGVKLFLFLPALIALTAFIPGIGPGIVWIPLAIYYLITGNYFAAIGVAITGVIISILIDNYLRLKIIGEKTKINPFIMFLGILGGISLFGFFGFIIGPLVLTYTIKLLAQNGSKK